MKIFFVLTLVAAPATVSLGRIERVSGEDEPAKHEPRTVAEWMNQAREIDPARTAAAVLSDYVIESPDVLLIKAAPLVPKSSLRLGASDEILILVGTGARVRINGKYTIDDEGNVNLGAKCGRVHLAGLTAREAEGAVQNELIEEVGKVPVSVTLHTGMNTQQIGGQHLVRADGCVDLGDFGFVDVSGMTPGKARAAIEKKLSERLESPEVTVEVLAINSKVYYIIEQHTGSGDEVARQRITGRETVMDAVAALGGIAKGSTPRMWISRPAADGKGVEKTLPINWRELANGDSTATNYELRPCDRLFIDYGSAQKKEVGDRVGAAGAILSAPPVPAAVPEPGYYTSANDSEAGMIQVHVAFVEDADGALADIDELKQHGTMIGDSEMVLSLLKILEKHKLVTKTGAPQLMCRVGDACKAEITTANEPSSGFRAGLESRRLDNKRVAVEVSARDGAEERRVEIVLEAGERKTIIMKLETQEKDAKKTSRPAKYVFVTPEVADGPMVYSWSLAK
jgi:protein involved in polysaccharide export with SLBB domain